MESVLNRIRSIANFQFGRNVGADLFPEGIEVAYSKATGRIRYVYLDGVRLVTLRPTDGLFSLSITGARRIAERITSAKCFVAVRTDVSEFIAKGGDVFAAHVTEANDEIRSKDEIIVTDGNGKVLAVGQAVLSGEEMRTFKRGVAVKVRRGCLEKVKYNKHLTNKTV